jgi:hypothetical protein
VVVTTTGFSDLARFTGEAAGVDELRVAEYPGPLGIHDPQEMARNIEGVLLERVVAALTRGASDDEARPARHSVRDPREMVFRGTFDDVNRYFASRGWSDALPIVPPTLARVEDFVQAVAQGPHERLAVLPSAQLAATPWILAVNAVMAGCGPEHMPLLVAAVQALADERCSLGNIGSSSGIFPYVLVNGPIVKELGIGCGAQAASRGPNPAIARAVGLIVRNVAGFRPGASYMGTFGYPLPFAFGEFEDESPWPSFHVEHGYERHESTVTIGVTNNWGSSPSPYDTPDLSGAQVALELICREVTKKTRLFNFPAIGDKAEKVMITVLMSPPVAKSLAAAGQSKADVKRYVYENARMPLGEFDWVLKYTATMRTTARERAQAGIYPAEYLGQPDARVRVLSSPDILHIVVCGDPGRNRIMVMEGGHTQPVTRRIVLPPNWDELLRARL